MANIRKVEYVDAHYSYRRVTKPAHKGVVSYGRVHGESKIDLDLELAWTESPHKVVLGVVIPKAAMLHAAPVRIARADSYDIGDVVAVYWNDIFVYHEDYDGPHISTPMLSEGTVMQETESYLLLHNPETLDLTHALNHPEIKPVRYWIPKVLISEIKLVRKHGHART